MSLNLKTLSKDVYENRVQEYGADGVSGQDALRNLFYEKLQVEPGTVGNQLHRAFRKHKEDVYEIIDVAVDAILPTILRNQFDSLANFHDIQFGQELRFSNPNTNLFRVANMAGGSQDIRRQNELSGSYKIETEWWGAATYIEFEQFLSGMVDWNAYVNKVAESFAGKIGERIYDTIAASYDDIRATRKHVGAGTVDLDKLTQIARHVRTASAGKAVTVYGTTTALSKVAPDVTLMSEGMKDGLNKIGYLGTVNGLNLIALPDAYRGNTEEFAVDDNTLLLIPSAEKIIDVVNEGGVQTVDGESSDNTGLQIDMNQRKKFGVATRQASVYGVYKITA